MKETAEFHGHPAIIATHRSTLQLTRDSHLTRKGECIVGVDTSKACIDLDFQFKKTLRKAYSSVRIQIIVDGLSFNLTAQGHPNLSLSHARDMVVRRSGYTCPRTLAIFSDKAAVDMPRIMVDLLSDSRTKGKIVIETSSSNQP